MPRVAELLDAFDAQLRDRVSGRLPHGVHVERDGPLLRVRGLQNGGFVLYRDLGGLESADLDELIARQLHVFGERGERFEWKVYGHDLPADLPQRLRAAGFVPEDVETVVIATVAEVAGRPVLPAGVALREVSDRADFDRIADLQQAIWQDDGYSLLLEELWAERAVDPEALSVVAAEAGSEIVCAAWVRFEQGTEFATLWGGGTLPAWRRRGIYRAIVLYRAGLAAERGFRFVSVDASDDSRPILERLGFVAVTTTTPFVWSPPTAGVS